MIRAYKYRVRLRPGEDAPFLAAMEECRRCYNAELEFALSTFRPWMEASSAARERGEKPARFESRYHWQGRSQAVTAWSREHPGFDALIRNCRTASTTERLHNAWSGFWRRWKPGVHPEQAGIPRFIRYGEFGALTWAVTGIRYIPAVGEPGTPPFRTHRIRLQPFGALRLFEDRPLPEGAHIKTATLSQEADGWYVSLVIDDGLAAPEPRPGRVLGIDLGARNFAVTSDGQFFSLPDFYRQEEGRRRVLSRTLARRLDVSREESRRRVVEVESRPRESWESEDARDNALRVARRYRTQGFVEARESLARQGQDLARRRKHHHIEVARALCAMEGIGVLAVEEMSVQEMTRRPKPRPKVVGAEGLETNGAARHAELSKSILNAGWYAFLLALRWQASQRGIEVVEVDPRDTSQICHHCGVKAPKWHPYWKAVFTCAACGRSSDSDYNAARIIQARAQAILDARQREAIQ